MHKKQAYNNFYYYQSIIWFPVAFSLDGSITITVGPVCHVHWFWFILLFLESRQQTLHVLPLHCGLTFTSSGSCRYAYTSRCWIIAVGMTSSNWVSKCTMLYHVSHVMLHLDNTHNTYYYTITYMRHENWLWLQLQLQRDYKWNAKDCDEGHYLVIYLSNSFKLLLKNFYCNQI